MQDGVAAATGQAAVAKTGCLYNYLSIHVYIHSHILL